MRRTETLEPWLAESWTRSDDGRRYSLKLRPGVAFADGELTVTARTQDVGEASGGKLQITVHAAASLFKAPEINRAVATGQAQAGGSGAHGGSGRPAKVRLPSAPAPEAGVEVAVLGDGIGVAHVGLRDVEGSTLRRALGDHHEVALRDVP